MKPVAFLCVLAATACFAAGLSPCGMTEPVPSAMRPLPPGALRLHGVVDDAIRKSVENWTLGKVPYREFAEFFRKGRPQFALGEMWGKFVRAAAMQYRYTGDERIRKVVEEAVADILAAERRNGSVSCDPPEAQPGGKDGDLWERKYVMLGLERYLENVCDDKTALESLVRQADCIISQVGMPPKAGILSLGWSANHVESSTLLEPFVNLYAKTGERRFLDFAKYIVGCGGAIGCDLVRAACVNELPHKMGEPYPKAYEMLSFFEGLLEYHRFTGNETAKKACLNMFGNVLTNELTIVGNGGGDYPYHPKVQGEAWDHTAFEQTNPAMKRMMETCVGVTWLKFCGRVLSLTGDVRAADAMERYVYNGLLGAMKPDGDGFSYVNLLNGVKTTDKGWGWNFPSGRVTCCNLNGPLGLAYVPFYAVMQGETGPVVNFYEAFEATARGGGENVHLTAPVGLFDGGAWRLNIDLARNTRFNLKLRIPGWSEWSVVRVCGQPVSNVCAGTYLDLEREWRPGDSVEVAFDLRARKLDAPKGSNRTGENFAAVMCGPVVLARDENTDAEFDADVNLVADASGGIAVQRVWPSGCGHRLEFDVPTDSGMIRMCDYASVDSWKGKRVMTWLPVCGVKVSSFGYDAKDSTRFLQQALDSGAKKIVLDRQEGMWVSGPLFGRSNQEIVFERGVELVAKKGAFRGKRDCLLVLDGVTNVTIRGKAGAALRMRRAEYAAPPYMRSEWRHALAVRNSRNVKVVGMTFAESGGDGVVVSGVSEGIELLDCTMTDNFRQGVSVISCRGFLAEGCLFTNTKGTNPESGIDFEPDRPSDRLVSCMVRNCRSVGNAGSAFHVAPVMLDSTSEPIGVRFENCRSEDDGMGVELALYRNRNYPTGRVVFAGCEFRSPRCGCLVVNKPAGTMDAVFSDCRFLDAVESDFLFQTEQWDFDPPDGMRFLNVSIRQPVDRPVFSFPVPGFGRKVDSLTGAIDVLSPSKASRIVLSPEWCAANVPRASGGEPQPRVTANLVGCWPCGGDSDTMRRFMPVAVAHRQRFLFRVDTPRMVRLSVRQIPGKSGICSPVPLKIGRVPGGPRLEIPMPEGGPATVSFDAKTPGIYAMELDAYHSRFIIDAANVPVAIDATRRYREFCLTPDAEMFAFSFAARKDSPFTLLTRVIYPDDEYVCELFDSEGRCVAKSRLPHQWNVLSGHANGLVRAVFTRSKKTTSRGNVFVDITGAPGLLFISELDSSSACLDRL